MKRANWGWLAIIGLIGIAVICVVVVLQRQHTSASQETIAALTDSQVLLERDMANLEAQLKAELARLAASLDVYAKRDEVVRSLDAIENELAKVSEAVKTLYSDERVSNLAEQLCSVRSGFHLS